MIDPQLKKYTVNIDGEDITLYDIHTSRTLDFVIPEAIHGDEYKIKSMKFSPGDVVVDIGANVGSVSIMLAKKFPFIKIYAYEAHPVNYQNLIRNIEINNVQNVMAFNKAVYSEDDCYLEMNLNIDNTGASNPFVDAEKEPNLYAPEHAKVEVPTITLDTIISSHQIDKIKFLKIDCEGSEFEIIESSELIRTIPIEYLSCEIHVFMEHLGKNTIELINKLRTISSTPPTIKLV